MTTPSAPRISEDELARLEELAGKATPGPWKFTVEGRDAVVVSRDKDADAAFVAALSPDVVLRLIAAARSAPAAGLDVAWAEAEAALPEGWWLREVVRDGNATIYRWQADAVGPKHWEEMYGDGPTPVAALRALADKLRESKP